LNGKKGDEEKKLDAQKSELKKLEGQKTGLEAALKTTTSKTETTRITKEITQVTEWITKLTTALTKIEKEITEITTEITTVTTKWTTTITEATTTLSKAKADAEKSETAAGKAVNTLPGTPGDSKKADKDSKEGKIAGSKEGKEKSILGTDKKTTEEITSAVAEPTAGITDVPTTVVKVTEDAKQKRIKCTRATKRLTNQKEAIAAKVKQDKKDIEEGKKATEECKAKLKDEHLEYAKTQADANAIAAKDAGKFQELTLKLKALQLTLDNGAKKCNEGEEELEKMFKKIENKGDEVKDLVAFVTTTCAEASQAEDEVKTTIQIITEIEVVNRLYRKYIQSVQDLASQEKLMET